ncbi:MAG: endonuclease III [Alphaproteobacteria bacterium]|nr:endonuclease III [Alphaproteobacteria bacterium]
MLTDNEVEEFFRRLQDRMPKRSAEPHVKEDPDHFRALVSCLLSAQSRDANTAKAKNALFRLADTPEGILMLPDADIAAAIKPAGLYNIKTRRVKALCRALLDEYDGIVPKDRPSLMELPGIGRKCADIMLLFSFGEPAIAVDTHVHRVSNRTGLARGKTEAQTAAALEPRAPQWAMMDGHMWLLEFGKRTCTSRAPKCAACFLNDLCEAPRL